MLRVLFVDDEAHILRGLRRSMTSMGDEWDMTFCASGAEALALMQREAAFDVVVSDMRMPAMDGAEFLGIVRQRHPETIRVILSGYADVESILRTVGPAHIYLAKPCDAETLHKAISRPIALKRLLSTPSLRAVLAGLNNLPSLPDVVLKVGEELRSPQCSAKSLAALIDKDVAMTAELLRLTNSAYFSVASPVTTTLQAVRTIGLETIQALVLQIGIFRQFSGNPAVAPLLENLTGYCLATANLAEAIAASMGADQATAKATHCAAMLSRIGILVLLDAYPDTYTEILAMIGTDMSLHAAEQQVFGANHALIGAYLLGLWGFSPPLVEAVAFAATPSTGLDHDNTMLTALHAATSLSLPLASVFSPEIQVQNRLDMAYLIEARRDGLISSWRELAQKLSGEKT
ncbi:response regulator [Paramagnetospirillum caucaseum]|uniref:Response regulator n=2 Tax=Paramagnetospirillum caucaseum TaxID=1244869 RepID=M2ZNH0_9PROT|nr:response regulator [Paramagnetospirillum caucaseum]